MHLMDIVAQMGQKWARYSLPSVLGRKIVMLCEALWCFTTGQQWMLMACFLLNNVLVLEMGFLICPFYSLIPLGFSLIHLIATGISCFFGSSLLTFVIYVYCQRCQRQSQESTVIHPTTPNHLHYKGNTTPKNEKYTPMEFKVRSFICQWV